MSWTIRSVVGAGAVALLAMASVVVAGTASPAAADTPTVVVTPDLVASGDRVVVEYSGFTGTESVLPVICESAAVQTGYDESICRWLFILPLSPAASRIDVSVSGIFDPLASGTGDINCAVVEGGCVIGVIQVEIGGGLPLTPIAEAYDAIAFYPTLSGTPHRNLTDGDTVAVSGSLVPPGEWSLAQCGRAYLDDPTPARAATLCGPSVDVTADAEASFATDVVVHDPLVPTAAGAESVPCGYEGCVVVVSNESLPVTDELELSFGDMEVTVTPNDDLPEVSSVGVAIRGMPDDVGNVTAVQCALPLGSTREESRCSALDPTSPALDGWGSGTVSLTVRAQFLATQRGSSAGPPVDCRVTGCAVALFVRGPVQEVVESVPLQFAQPKDLTITPATDLLDWQFVHVTANGLAPGAYRLDYCVPGGLCTPGMPVTVDGGGNLDASVPVGQRMAVGPGANVYCRAQCVLYLWSVGRNAYVATGGYAMSEGSLAVWPSTGLTTGQTVVVAGDKLMPTYAGANFWNAPTGNWFLVQCDRRVLEVPALLGVLGSCGMQQAMPVTIYGSTFYATFNVTSLLLTLPGLLQGGNYVNCMAEPGACVVGLVRLEQDGSLSHHLAPITFGT